MRLCSASSGQSTGERVGHSNVRCTQLSDVPSMILFVGSVAGTSRQFRVCGQYQNLEPLIH